MWLGLWIAVESDDWQVLSHDIGVGSSDCFCCVEVMVFGVCLLAGIFRRDEFGGGNSSPSRGGGQRPPKGRDIGCGILLSFTSANHRIQLRFTNPSAPTDKSAIFQATFQELNTPLTRLTPTKTVTTPIQMILTLSKLSLLKSHRHIQKNKDKHQWSHQKKEANGHYSFDNWTNM